MPIVRSILGQIPCVLRQRRNIRDNTETRHKKMVTAHDQTVCILPEVKKG